MFPLVVVLVCFVIYFLGYRFYGTYIAKKVFGLSDKKGITPAHKFNDGIDYIPTKPSILFGHHYASIAGLAPILGPAVGVIWGWFPALIWVVLGSVFIGCIQDFGSIVISVRNKGESIGQVASHLIGKKARTLFHIIIFFLVSLAMGVFVLVIADMFSAPTINPFLEKQKIETSTISQPININEFKKNHHNPEIRIKTKNHFEFRSNFPEAVMPSVALLVFALIVGYLHYKKKQSIGILSFLSFIGMLIVIYFGMNEEFLLWSGLMDQKTSFSSDSWKIILLIYAFIASVTPVWLLLQSRDFINSLLLYLGIFLIYLGFIFGSFTSSDFASFHTNWIRTDVGGLEILPFVFITIACGAASGFHALVGSGTTAKQIDKEIHALPMGYGGMIGESLLALTSIIACTVGFTSNSEWLQLYSSWSGIQGLAPQVGAYIYGTGRFIAKLGIDEMFAQGFIALIVVSFALTSLDSAARLLRYNIEEIVQSTNSKTLIKLVGNRYVSSILACLSIGLFAFFKIEQNGVMKPAGLALWKVFGTTNQLLAGLALLVIVVYIVSIKKNPISYLIAMIFILVVTLWAMCSNFYEFLLGDTPNLLLAIIGGLLIILTLWLLVEAFFAFKRWKKIK